MKRTDRVMSSIRPDTDHERKHTRRLVMHARQRHSSPVIRRFLAMFVFTFAVLPLWRSLLAADKQNAEVTDAKKTVALNQVQADWVIKPEEAIEWHGVKDKLGPA